MTRSNDLIHRMEAALGQPGAASSDFDLNPETDLPDTRKLRDAAVLMLVSEFEDAPSVYLTKRASGLKHHPGQVAFPGGKLDPTDANLQAAALREAREEIALPEGAAQVMGSLPPHETVTGFTVTPFVARLIRPFTPVVETGEVAEVFSVPLTHLLDPNRYSIEGRHWRGATRYYYTIPFGPYYIWGATARMLRTLAERVAE